MKILFRDLKHGVIKLRVENLDDLWYLSGIIKENDKVKTKTERRIKAKNDVIREKSIRETITLTIKVDNIDFSSDSKALKISGTILEGPEDLISLGSYHTFNIQEGSILKIKKEKFSEIELQRLNDAEKATLRPKILILAIDEGEATLGLVRESKVEYVELSKSIGGKYDIKGRSERKGKFYKELGNFILGFFDKENNISGIIISGSGFEPENFYKFFFENYKNLKEKTFLEKSASSGRLAIKEVIQKPIMKKISENINSAREVQEVNKLLEEIGRNSGLGCYGVKEIETAAEIGAIELLLISDNFFLKNREFIEKIIENVKNKRGLFHLINHKNEPGQQLEALGGIAGILRFKITES